MFQEKGNFKQDCLFRFASRYLSQGAHKQNSRTLQTPEIPEFRLSRCNIKGRFASVTEMMFENRDECHVPDCCGRPIKVRHRCWRYVYNEWSQPDHNSFDFFRW
jgi:hypothetical protein